MSGNVFFHEGGIHVDPTRVIINNDTYSVRTIASITTNKVTVSNFGDGCLLICLTVGGSFIAIIVIALLTAASNDHNNIHPVSLVIIGIIFIGALVIVGYGIKIMFSENKTTYYIYLKMASGESRSIPDQDYGRHQRLLQALNEAIAGRL